MNFNRFSETRETTRHLRTLFQKRQDIEIIAVDNGSNDGTADYLKKQTGWLRVIQLNDNDGIAGYNQAFKIATGDIILVLDDDSCPEHETIVDQLFNIFDTHPKIGVIACRIVTPNGDIQWSWHLPKQLKAGRSPAFIGCGFAIRRDLFKKIGWYPERFFLYQNEIDVAFRIRRLGSQIHYAPDCVVVHRGIPAQRPGWRRIYYPTRNTIWIIRSFYPRPESYYLIGSRILIGFIRSIRFRQTTCFFRALKDGLCEPIKSEILPNSLRKESKEFWRQNSFWHQLIRRT